MRLRLMILITFFVVLIVNSCSTQKNNLLTRTYHQVTAKYNIYFNGRESFRSGVKIAEQQYRYDYNKILPVFLYTDPEIASSVTPDMDRAIEKASKVIANKSITARPDEGGGLFSNGNEDFFRQNEYNKWVRESYLLAGKAHFYKHDFNPAAQTFLFIVRQYSMNSISHDGKIWLARTYSERGRFHEAKMLMDEMLNDNEFPSRLDAELYSTIADFNLKQDQLEQAAISLESALDAGPGKDRKIRYTYILAQLYERTGDYSRASEYYSRVISMNPPYEMVFNASISQAGVVQTGTGESSRMISSLGKMLRDDKNRDYQDQIYFALGNIYLRINDEDNALRHFEMSAAARGLNPSQKTVTYLAIADIYYEHQDYINAQAYYDSAVMNMGQTFPDRQLIVGKSNILTDLVNNIRQFELEDSVQMLAAMSENDRNRKIDDIIAQVREDEANSRRQEQQSQQTGQYRAARTSQAARRQAEQSGGGNWYFYNQSAVTFGQDEFDAIWGERRLEDNWRRSNRQVITADEIALSEDEQPLDDTEGEGSADIKSRDFYLENIPLTDEALVASHRRLKEALFNMGNIFMVELDNPDRSVRAFEELVKRYPDGELSMLAYYDLHNVHFRNSNFQRADYYKELILSKYPGSVYASALTNPDFFREYEQQMQEAENYYEETFNLFKERNFEQVRKRAEYAVDEWPDTPLLPRFEYLSILSFGSDGNIPLFREMLSDYINRYPETVMAEDARHFIIYLEEDYPEVINESDVRIVGDIYKSAPQGEHYFVIIVENKQDLINRMIFNIVNFNVDNFAREELNVSSEDFSTNYQLIRVDGLENTTTAMDYLRRFSVSDEVFEETGSDDYNMFIISPENFNLFMQDKNIASYMKFFEDEYPDL